jgi:hypothetical protein
MGDDFEPLAMKFMSKESLIKLLHCGTRVLAEIGHQTILAILNSTCAPK